MPTSFFRLWCFNINTSKLMYLNHLEILLQCGFWFRRAGMEHVKILYSLTIIGKCQSCRSTDHTLRSKVSAVWTMYFLRLSSSWTVILWFLYHGYSINACWIDKNWWVKFIYLKFICLRHIFICQIFPTF